MGTAQARPLVPGPGPVLGQRWSSQSPRVTETGSERVLSRPGRGLGLVAFCGTARRGSRPGPLSHSAREGGRGWAREGCEPCPGLSSALLRVPGPGPVLRPSAQPRQPLGSPSPVRAGLWLPWDRASVWGTVAHSAGDRGSVGWVSGVVLGPGPQGPEPPLQSRLSRATGWPQL